jgi:DNA-binding IclR family transcriptional regulator
MSAAARTSSSARVFDLLDLYTVDRPIWSVDALARRLAIGPATAYRYVKVLTQRGYLSSVAGGNYVLGARFIEIDRQIRLADPLLRVAPPIMARVRDDVKGTQALCSHYEDRVICIHDDTYEGGVVNRMTRGQPFPLFKGVPSKVILAHLPSAQIRRLMDHHSDEIAQAGLGSTLPELRGSLRQIRRTGYHAAQGMISTEAFAIAAPVFRDDGQIAAALCFSWPLNECDETTVPRFAPLLSETAREISRELHLHAKRAAAG